MKRGLIYASIFILLSSMALVAAAHGAGPPYPSCVDSDGNNVAIKGNTTYQLSLASTPIVSHDSCADQDTVLELSCNPNTHLSQSFPTPCFGGDRCVDGACTDVPAPPSDVIFRLSANKNAHGEVWTGGYTKPIRYSQIYNFTYDGPGNNECTTNGSNRILKLSSPTNAHAQGPNETGYTTNVCYGDLDCTVRSGGCASDEQCVVTLSGFDNAHLTKCTNQDAYTLKVCCESPSGTTSGYCNAFQTKQECWAPNTRGISCSWWPPNVNTTAQGGGCCGPDEAWDSFEGRCTSVTAGICNDPWSTENQVEPTSRRKLATGIQHFDQYCAELQQGVSTGLWTNVDSY